MNREEVLVIIGNAKERGVVANLSGADLRGADLSGADLRGADLRWAKLSGALGLLGARDWVREHCAIRDGMIMAYKLQTHIADHPWPASWRWEAGAVLTENVCTDRTIDCACGVNVGTRDWCNKNRESGVPLWEVLVDPIGIVVPYATDGKFRAERVTLVGLV